MSLAEMKIEMQLLYGIYCNV